MQAHLTISPEIVLTPVYTCTLCKHTLNWVVNVALWDSYEWSACYKSNELLLLLFIIIIIIDRAEFFSSNSQLTVSIGLMHSSYRAIG